jgi:terminase small subunit / prophage DNA-packing protein
MTETPTHGGKRAGAGRKPGQRLPDHERLLRAKADKETALARLRKLEADVAEGRLIPVDTLRDVLANVAAQIAAILDTIPGSVRREAPHLSAQDVELLARIVTKARNVASEARYTP